VPNIFTHVGRPSGEMHEVWLSEKEYAHMDMFYAIVTIFNQLEGI